MCIRDRQDTFQELTDTKYYDDRNDLTVSNFTAFVTIQYEFGFVYYFFIHLITFSKENISKFKNFSKPQK